MKLKVRRLSVAVVAFLVALIWLLINPASYDEIFTKVENTGAEAGIDFELIFISDGSKDRTYEEILKAAAGNPHVKGAEFSRNFGKEAGIFAGLSLALGDAVIVMDCSFLVSKSFADTLRIPFASISKVTSICGTPAGAFRIPFNQSCGNTTDRLNGKTHWCNIQ